MKAVSIFFTHFFFSRVGRKCKKVPQVHWDIALVYIETMTNNACIGRSFDCTFWLQGAHHRCRSKALPSKICHRISKPDFFSRKKMVLPLICRRNYEPKFFCGKKWIPKNTCRKNKNADHITCRIRYTLHFLCHHKVWVLLQCRNNDIPFKYCH